MKAPVSLCLIVKNEPLLEPCLQSLRDYVEEIVIVDTGSTSQECLDVARKYADIFEIYTACNDPTTGLIDSFSQARQRSFDLATKDWVLWVDADDVVEGGEHLMRLVSSFQSTPELDAVAFMFPYEYSYDGAGKCVCRHYRERLFSNKKHFHWVNPVHEVIIINDGLKVQLISDESLIYKHRRQYSQKQVESGRNLRILKKYVEGAGKDDARQMYYIGLEYFNNGFVKEAIDSLTRYIDISGWDDERIMACLKLVDIYQGINQYQEALKWAFKAVELGENWSEGYLAVGRMFYFIAMAGGHNTHKNWQRCIHFIRLGLSMPPTKTLLFVNPVDREFEIHKYLNIALNATGDVRGALESANIGLKYQQDPMLLGNKNLYAKFLATQEIASALNTLKDIGSLDEKAAEIVLSSINGQSTQQFIDTFPPYKRSPTYPKDITIDQFPAAVITPHPQAWGIPNNTEFDSLPLRMTDEQLEAVVIMIWKQYILHDEVLSAVSFLEHAPFNIRDRKMIQFAQKLTYDMYSWLKNPALMQTVNAPENTTVETDQPLPLPLVKQSSGRFHLIASSLAPPRASIVDFGCFDGCFTNRYGLLGYEVYGLDLVESSVALANKKALEFNTGARHIITHFQDAANKVPNNHFDYATSTDTYEHLIDPVNDMFMPAKKMLKQDGKFLLCTPYGAWMRGNFIPWAHPWMWAQEGYSWLRSHPRWHLVAPSSWSVTKDFRNAGYYVKNCYPVMCDYQDVPEQGNIFAEAHMQKPSNEPGLDIVFFIGQGVEEWTPQTVKKNGIGGSELMAIEMSKRLAKQGHRVRLYNSCGKHGEGIYDGVEYHHYEKYQDLECDVLIISRLAPMIDEKYNVKAKLKLLWVHDIYAIQATTEMLYKYDKILALSEWHKHNMVSVHNISPHHILVTRNGIDINRFKKEIKRDKYKVVNSSSPDRYLPILLDCWPEIKSQVPEATLHVFYGFKNWEYAAQHDPNQMALITRLKSQMEALKSAGVIFRDRVSQEQLAEEFLSAGVWAYSTWFTETSCISAMEAQSAGLRIITSPIAALKETVSNRGTMIEGDWASPEYKKKFVEAVVSALQKDDDSDRPALQKYADQNFDLSNLACDWHKMFLSLIKEVEENTLIPFV